MPSLRQDSWKRFFFDILSHNQLITLLQSVSAIFQRFVSLHLLCTKAKSSGKLHC